MSTEIKAVDASFITRANALLEEYESFKREMRVADRRMQQHRDRARKAKESRPHDEPIYMRILMMYEGAKRMMCNRVRLLVSMGVAVPGFPEGVTSLPDTIMTEGPFDITPSGDAAEEKRSESKRAKRRVLNLSEEGEGLTPQEVTSLDEMLDDDVSPANPARAPKMLDPEAFDIGNFLQSRIIPSRPPNITLPQSASIDTPLDRQVIRSLADVVAGLDFSSAEDGMSRYMAMAMPLRNRAEPVVTDPPEMGGIRIVTVPGMPDGDVEVVSSAIGRMASENPMASNTPKKAQIKNSVEMRNDEEEDDPAPYVSE